MRTGTPEAGLEDVMLALQLQHESLGLDFVGHRKVRGKVGATIRVQWTLIVTNPSQRIQEELGPVELDRLDLTHMRLDASRHEAVDAKIQVSEPVHACVPDGGPWFRDDRNDS
jgi:hypothetical protein